MRFLTSAVVRALLVGALFVSVGCSCTSLKQNLRRDFTSAEVEAAHPGITRFTPDVLHRNAWLYVQQCSRTMLPRAMADARFQQVVWYVSKNPLFLMTKNGPMRANAIYYAPRYIVMAEEAMQDFRVISHELLHHHLLNNPRRQGRGHPREYFYEMCKVAELENTDPLPAEGS